MKNLKFDKLFIIQRLRENRKKHEEVFNQALAGYQTKAIDELNRLIEHVKSNPEKQLYVAERAPSNHLKQYDRIILMLEQCTETEIELDEKEYTNYIQDNWEWTQHFYSSNSMYSTIASGCAASL